MKKILLSVLTLALSVNLFAINYSGQITVAVFDGSHIHNATIAESSDVPSGELLNGYYSPVQDMASLNVAAYVSFNNVAYENIVLNSLTNTPLVIKANAATAYKLYFTNKEGSITLYDTKEQAFVDLATSPYEFTIEESEKNSVIANRFIFNYVASICFSNDVLDVIGYEGKTLKVEKEDGTPVVAEHALASNAEHFNLAQPSRTRLVVTLDGKVYQIDASVVPDPVVP